MALLTDAYKFNVALKVFPTEGNMAYEYNPFYNYRVDLTMYYYKNSLMTEEELLNELGISSIPKDSWNSIIPAGETPPIVYLKGQLTDFETDLLLFDLNHPVDIIPQYSYDNSVNLIINDGKNPPRMINSRFSATEKNKYLVCNRSGDNDSNIYDLGELFDIDTSLYKKINTIPLLKFLGLSYGGNLSIGNYHFYFKYVDEDGNESDFFCESGLVSVFIGNSASSIRSGFRDEISYKLCKFIISNTDPGYHKIAIYYTKATSDIYENPSVTAKKLSLAFVLNDNGTTVITITGFEEVIEVPLTEINTFYQIYGDAEALASALNMLFLGNVSRPKIPYEDLADCALRFIPVLNTDEKYNMNLLGYNYLGNVKNTYYDPLMIYNRVGYWDDEIYRFGIVFIMSDNTLTEVFNVRGGEISELPSSFTELPFIENNDRTYILYDELYYTIPSSDSYLENVKGVVKINYSSQSTIAGINFKVSNQVLGYLKNTLHIKGFFFVRLKRIPTTLCQAYTIGIDKESHTPVLYVKDGEAKKYITESFLCLDSGDDLNILTHDFKKRIYTLENQQVNVQGAICPEYDVDYPHLNSLFSASELVCRDCSEDHPLILTDTNYHYAPSLFEFKKNNNYTNIKVIGVLDNVKLVGINDYMFSSRAGEAEEAFRYEYIGKKSLNTNATNLLRGEYGPFLGITGYENPGHLIDIKIPGFNPSNMEDYFGIRYADKSSYYAISDRFSFDAIEDWGNVEIFKNRFDEIDTSLSTLLDTPLYRGDCYICQFTHRLNRNFLDPSSPINDTIVDPKTWKDNYEVKDGVVKVENFEKINLGDVNAVRLGMYVTLVVRSTYNLNIRNIDDSTPDETALTGHARGFYPYSPLTTKGAYKTPEALCINSGFSKSLSERCNFEHPDVPWIKNEFSNRIAYSSPLVQDAFQNGWRTFFGSHYRDYPKTYGSITKLIELNGDLLCVFEHGVALIPINERALAGEGSGGTVYVNTSNVLPDNPKIISDTFGSQWKDSVIKTPRGVYGVDTVGKKIWRTNGQDFECISDFNILEFLNKNISLTERELEPIIGVRNVKTHYNKFKQDVMFTFYDNLYDFEEKVWNVCFNEVLLKWITFYSWVPSYSENIYNLYYSFDRNTSKWISKLAVSTKGSAFEDGVVLSKTTIPNDLKKGSSFATLDLVNRNFPIGDGITINKSFELLNHDKEFRIKDDKIYLNVDAVDLCSELYVRARSDNNNVIGTTDEWKLNCVLSNNSYTCKDELGRRMLLEDKINSDNIVYLLKIKCHVTINYSGTNTLGEALATGSTNTTVVDRGYYSSVVAVIPQYNKLFLTTDFWKHGQAGIIDIADSINPTYWYGTLHPFEVEFVVNDNPLLHKIFDNLEIISNAAAPESFHYEVIGDCYNFAKDKKNMYIRQEATKHLFQFNGVDIIYDRDYSKLKEYHRPLRSDKGLVYDNLYDRSTLLPLYYYRIDKRNYIEDFYHSKNNVGGEDFSALSGAEIMKYNEEYRICNHAKAVDFLESGRMRGNMHYKEDKWYVLINPLNVVYRNELAWKDLNGNDTDKIPVELNLYPLPEDLKGAYELIPPDKFIEDGRGTTMWNWQSNHIEEAKIKDKFVKIRIRYKGDDLAIIHAIKTMYSISYS